MLLIAGSGEREAELREYARALKVENHVRFLGFVKHIRRFLESLDIFILSSLYEGFGYVLTEAMAARKPVIAFQVSSNPEIVEHGRTGFLVKLGDVEALADSVETLRRDEPLRRRLGDNGRQRVENNFTIEQTLERVIALLNSEG
jgi:glycosyltransferase involved in cell wall biosynthesis